MKVDWEMKEEVILSIAWDEPAQEVAFDIFTIETVLEKCVTLRQAQDSTYLYLYFN